MLTTVLHPLPKVALLLVLSLSTTTRWRDGETARSVVSSAARAVERDSVPAARARWEARLDRDPGDRAAMLGLATLYRLTYSDSAAEQLYTRLHDPRTARADAYLAWALVGHAQLLDRLNRRSEVGPALDRALATARAVHDSSAEAAALLELGFQRANTLGVPAGFAALDSAARRIPSDAPDLLADLYRRRTIIRAAIGDASARATADSAITAARAAGGPQLEGVCTRALAQVYDLQGQNDSAVVTYERAETLLRRAHDRGQLALSIARRANVLRALARFGEMRVALRAALVEATAAHDEATASAVHTALAALALQLGDLPTASDELRVARARFTAAGDSANLALVNHFAAAAALAAGELEDARRYAESAAAWARRVGENSTAYEELRLLIAIHAMAGNAAAADTALGRARDLARRQRHPSWLLGLLGDEARLRLRRGDLVAAERLFTSYLAAADTTDRLRQYDARMHLAEVYARRGALDRAAAEARAASELLDRWRATLSDRDTRVLAFQATPSERDQRRAVVARVLDILALGGHTDDALALAEQRRARDLADQLRQAAAMRERDVARGASLATVTAPAPVAAMAPRALARALPDDSTALLEYVVGADDAPTTLFVLTRDTTRAYALPPADSLVRTVGAFVALLESGAGARALSRELGAALLDSAVGALGPAIRRLVVVPDGVLHRVPFDALTLADGRYAIERYTIASVPSATVLGLLRDRDHHRGSPHAGSRVLALGDPAFGGDDAGGVRDASSFRSAFAETGGLPRLVESGREARLVGSYGDSAVVRLREQATAEWLMRASLREFDVVHLATHALVDDRSPARTALALAPGHADEDGFLGPGDLATLRLDGALVVLSACRTARGAIVRGEGVQGLTSPLLEAGARTVVATRWRVHDRDALAMVSGFYEHLARGADVGDALRLAKLDALQHGAPPGTWAAFAVIGDPLLHVALRSPIRIRWWPIAGAVLAIAAIAAFAAARYGARTVRRRAVERVAAPSSP